MKTWGILHGLSARMSEKGAQGEIALEVRVAGAVSELEMVARGQIIARKKH